MTPFIDVILVLSIIFMVAAPLSTVDVPIDLPSSTAVPQKKPDKPTYVILKADLSVAVGETGVERVDLLRTPDAAQEAKEGTPKVTTSQASAAPESVASEPAAPPPIPEASEATVTRAPVLGASARAMRMTWQKQLIGHLNRFKRYPSTGSRHAAEIVVALTLDRSGHVASAAIQTS